MERPEITVTDIGIGNDPHIFIWCLNWWPWAITHRLKPFVSHYIWYPHGYNLTWVTSVPAAALLMWPLTWLANPVVSFNVLSLLAPALSAWTAFLLARYLTRDTFSSFIGGYLFGFSSYELGQLLGHLHTNLIFVVPLLLLFVVQRVKGDLSRPRFLAAAGLQYPSGDAAIVIDVDLQDLPESIHEMVQKWQQGFEVVYAQRRTRDGETWIKKMVSVAGYKLINQIAEVEIPPNTGRLPTIEPARGGRDQSPQGMSWIFEENGGSGWFSAN